MRQIRIASLRFFEVDSHSPGLSRLQPPEPGGYCLRRCSDANFFDLRGSQPHKTVPFPSLGLSTVDLVTRHELSFNQSCTWTHGGYTHHNYGLTHCRRISPFEMCIVVFHPWHVSSRMKVATVLGGVQKTWKHNSFYVAFHTFHFEVSLCLYQNNFPSWWLQSLQCVNLYIMIS